jgi:hypothetical protein
LPGARPVPDVFNPRIHPFANDIAIQGPPEPAKRLPVFLVKPVGRIENTEIMVDAGALNTGVFSAPVDFGVVQVVNRHTIPAKPVIPFYQ